MKFLLVLSRTKFHVYDIENGYTLQHINGAPYLSYELQKAKEGVDKLISMLVEEFNLENSNSIKFDILRSTEEPVNRILISLLKEYIDEQYDVLMCLKVAVESIKADDKIMLLSECGINYEGHCYKKAFEGNFEISDFSLLAYTISNDILVEIIRKNVG